MGFRATYLALLVLLSLNLGATQSYAHVGHDHDDEHSDTCCDAGAPALKEVHEFIEQSQIFSINQDSVITGPLADEALAFQNKLIAAVLERYDTSLTLKKDPWHGRLKSYAKDWISHLNPISIFNMVRDVARRRGIAIGVAFAVSEFSCQAMIAYSATHPQSSLGWFAGFLGVTHFDDVLVASSFVWGPKMVRYFSELIRFVGPVNQFEYYQSIRKELPIDWQLNPFFYSTNEGERFIVVERHRFSRYLPRWIELFWDARILAQEEAFPTIRFSELKAAAIKAGITPPKEKFFDFGFERHQRLKFIEKTARLMGVLTRTSKGKAVLSKLYAQVSNIPGQTAPVNSVFRKQPFSPKATAELLSNTIHAELIRLESVLATSQDLKVIKTTRKEAEGLRAAQKALRGPQIKEWDQLTKWLDSYQSKIGGLSFRCAELLTQP